MVRVDLWRVVDLKVVVVLFDNGTGLEIDVYEVELRVVELYG